MVMGIVLFLLTATFVVYIQYTERNRVEIVSAQSSRVVNKIIDAAEEVFYLGEPSKNTIKIYMPSNIDSVNGKSF